MSHRFLYKAGSFCKEDMLAKRRNIVGQIRTTRRIQEFEKRRQLISEHGEGGDATQKEAPEMGNEVVRELLLLIEKADDAECTNDQQLRAKQKICQLVSGIKHPMQIDAALELGILEKLGNYICAPTLQEVAGQAVRQICGGSAHQVDQVFACGLVPRLFELLVSSDTKVLFEALCALGNIINLGTKYCEQLIDMGFLAEFTASLKLDMDLKMIHLFSLNVAALTSFYYKDWQQHTIEHLLPFIKMLMEAADDNVNFNCLCSLVYVTSGENANGIVDEMFQIGLVEKVIEQLDKHEVEVLCWATLQIVERIVMIKDDDVREIINTNVLPHLSKLLKKKPNLSIVQSGLRALASICTGNPARIAAVFNADLFPVIMFYVETGSGEEQILAGWALSNILLSGCDNLIYESITANVLSSITRLLPLPCHKLIYNLLLGLVHAFELFKENEQYLVAVVQTSGMYERLERLQRIENTDIAGISRRLYDTINRCILTEKSDNQKN